MEKHLYKEYAKKYYRGGQIYFCSDFHFADFDCYMKRVEYISNKIKHSSTTDSLTEAETAIYNASIDYNTFPMTKEEFVKICDEAQLKSINKAVHKNDTLICLGDVGDIDNPEVIKCLKKLKAGYKVLIMGNHDKGETKFEDYFDEVYPGRLFISDKIKLSHIPAPEVDTINFHGHDHAHNDGLCFAMEHIGYIPVCFKHLIEKGILGKCKDTFRTTIDRATERKRKKGGK